MAPTSTRKLARPVKLWRGLKARNSEKRKGSASSTVRSDRSGPVRFLFKGHAPGLLSQMKSGMPETDYDHTPALELIWLTRSTVEGTVQNIGGKVEEAAGYVAGDPGARVEGKVRQVAGKAQAAYGKAADTVADTVSRTSERLQEKTKHQPLPALLFAGLIGFVLGRWSVSR